METPADAVFMGTPRSARPAPTNGWDVVSAVRIAEVNQAIAAAGSSPEGFETDGGGVRAAGAFGPWTLTEDGDGPLITLRVPMHGVDLDTGGKARTIASATAAVRVRLELLPTGRMRAGADGPAGAEHLLVVRTGVDAGLLSADPAARAAKVLDIETSQDLPITATAALMQALEDWLNANLHAFRHVFGAVDIVSMTEEEAQGTAFAWLKPSSVSYAFGANRRHPDRSILAFLCQTAGRSSGGLVHQTEADAIPDGAQAGLCISYRRFLSDMLAPSLAFTFKGLKVTARHFKAQDTGLYFPDPIQLDKQTIDGATYAPAIERMEITLRDDEIEIESLTRTEITPGLYSMCQNVSAFTFGLLAGASGKTLGYKPTRQPIENHWKEQSPALDILHWMLLALSAVAVVVLGIATAGAFTAVAGAMVCALTGLGVAMLTQDIIGKVAEGKGPTIDLFALNATGSVRWCTGPRFDPVNAGLNGSLQIGGNLVAPKGVGPVAALQGFQAEFADFMAARPAAHPAP